MFKDSGLLDQRDHNGRTVLHGLLRNPILPHVYHDLVDFYGTEKAIQSSLRDNQNLSAAQHIRNVAEAQNPYASYGHVGYANKFIAQTEIPGNSIEETQNRTAVLRNSNLNMADSIPKILQDATLSIAWSYHPELILSKIPKDASISSSNTSSEQISITILKLAEHPFW